ncbi:cyanophycinase [Chryseobacterium pennipullorum]|uniref:Cyanophycinase n=1 Tax=Chryseobacterium pennipullorum TaxID=2258963 RepID=A0A3D9B027_9FLAO|nr:hypothetical protein [Chryseobacterium pennipullorum]REC46980.1 hypothetical protein DRF67_12210 [Chryseobacterium pennipullorum]
MIPKGRLIIIGGDNADEHERESPQYQSFSQISRLLSDKKDDRFEIITASESMESIQKYFCEILSKEGYNNFDFIHVHKNHHTEDYTSRILEAKIVFFADYEQKTYNILENSAILKLLNKKYLTEEDFTIVGINSGAMCISGHILNGSGTDTGLGFINNCIIDTQFDHKTRFKELVKAILSHQECLGLGITGRIALIIEKGYKASCIGNGSIIVVNAKNVKNKRFREGDSLFAKYLKGHILTEGCMLNLFSGELIKDNEFNYNLNFINRNTIQ